MKNRTHISLACFGLDSELRNDIHYSTGGNGAFEPNGISYPSVVIEGARLLIYHTARLKGIHAPWYEDLTLTISQDGVSFTHFSRTSVMLGGEREYVGCRPSCTVKNSEVWRMWCGRFLRGVLGPNNPPHYYYIKHSSASNGSVWMSYYEIHINYRDAKKFVIAKPCNLKVGYRYLIWYPHRDISYSPSHAKSLDSIY